jgi:hypothetical protein
LNSLLLGAPGVWFAPDATAPALASAITSALEVLHNPGSEATRFEHAFLQPFLVENSIPEWEKCLLELATRPRR